MNFVKHGCLLNEPTCIKGIKVYSVNEPTCIKGIKVYSLGLQFYEYCEIQFILSWILGCHTFIFYASL